MKSKYSLFVDIDDVLVYSSPIIQQQVNEKTVFKTVVLENIEQLRRNVLYFSKEVEKECQLAYKEKRLPDTNRFPKEIFNIKNTNLKFEELNDRDIQNIYIKPNSSCGYYLSIVNQILNQFLELRDMFLENDNLELGKAKEYNFSEEQKRLLLFKNKIIDSWDMIIKINKFCLSEATKISMNAKDNNIYPDYGDLVKTDSNDIIRTNINENDYTYFLYEKPIQDICRLISNDLLEYMLLNFNITRNASQELIDYDMIYQEKNVNKKAVLMIYKVMLSHNIDSLYLISHHNGLRECNAKKKLMKRLFPNGIFIGLRFHENEHNLERRDRSSKMDKAQTVCMSDPEYMILVDDSKPNCHDWQNKSGKVILYREVSDAEKTSRIENSEFLRITDFNMLEDAILKILGEEKGKVKSYER